MLIPTLDEMRELGIDPVLDYNPPDTAITSPVYRLENWSLDPNQTIYDLPIKQDGSNFPFIDEPSVLQKWLKTDKTALAPTQERSTLANACLRNADNRRRSTPREIYAFLQERAVNAHPYPELPGFTLHPTNFLTELDLDALALNSVLLDPTTNQLAVADPYICRLLASSHPSVTQHFQHIDPRTWQRTPLQLQADGNDWVVNGSVDPLVARYFAPHNTEANTWKLHGTIPARFPLVEIMPANNTSNGNSTPVSELFPKELLETVRKPDAAPDTSVYPFACYFTDDGSKAIIATHYLKSSHLILCHLLAPNNPALPPAQWIPIHELRALGQHYTWLSYTSEPRQSVLELYNQWAANVTDIAPDSPITETSTVDDQQTNSIEIPADLQLTASISDADLVGKAGKFLLPQQYVGNITKVGTVYCMGVAYDVRPNEKTQTLVYLSVAGTGSALDAVWADAIQNNAVMLNTPNHGMRLLRKEQKTYRRVGKYMDRLSMVHQIFLHPALADDIQQTKENDWLYILAETDQLAVRRFSDKLGLVTKLPFFDWEEELFALGKRMGFIRSCTTLGPFVCYAITTTAQSWETLIGATARKLGLPAEAMIIDDTQQ